MMSPLAYFSLLVLVITVRVHSVQLGVLVILHNTGHLLLNGVGRLLELFNQFFPVYVIRAMFGGLFLCGGCCFPLNGRLHLLQLILVQ